MAVKSKSLVKSNNSIVCGKGDNRPVQTLAQGVKKYDTHKNDNRPVSFITESEVSAICDQAKNSRHGSRDELLCLLMFQGCLRVSEALDLKLRDIGYRDNKYLLLVEHGKGDKERLLVIPESLHNRIWAYAGKQSITDKDQPLFTISRFQVLRIVKDCAVKAGINKRVYNHLFRHGGSVKRLMATGNLKSLQMYLGHSDSKMTMRYQNTMQIIQALEVESKVEFER